MITQEKSLHEISDRNGDRPITGAALPHLQFSDNSPKYIYEQLAEWLFSLEYVEERPTIISVVGARAAWIKDTYEKVNEDVLQIGREFTHIHPAADDEIGGSLHLSLKRDDCETVIEKGWGEYHPMDSIAFPDKTYGHILIYAPRNLDELEIIKTITNTSYKLVINQN